MAGHDAPPGSEGWLSYFDGLPEELRQFEAEASDFMARLTRQVAISANMRVLDFGCGLGFVASHLARRVATISVWDVSARMRRRAVERASQYGNAESIDLSRGSAAGVRPFDLIIVNSVVQYVPERELAHVMRLWRELLAPSGTVILSDVVPVTSRMAGEIADTLMFSVRHGLLFASLAGMYREFKRYAAVRRRAPLLRMSPDRVEAMAVAAGFECRALPANLTFRRDRLSFALSPRHAAT